MKFIRKFIAVMMAMALITPQIAFASDVTVGDVTLTGSSGWDIALVYDGENVTPKVQINNQSADIINVFICTAVYDGSGALAHLASAKVDVPQGEDYYLGKSLHVNTLPNNYRLSVFVWDNTFNLIPLRKIYTYDETKAFTEKSMNMVDAEEFATAPTPFDGTPESLTLTDTAVTQSSGVDKLSLDGEWEMIQGGSASELVTSSVVSADSGSDTAALAFDVNTSTAWVSDSASPSHWLTIDLGSLQTLRRVKIYHSQTAAEVTKAFSIKGSSDGDTWTDIATKTNNTDSVTEHTFTAATYRYLKINITTPSQTSSNTAKILEVEAYKVQVRETLLTGATVTTDTTFGAFLPSRLVDGKWAVEDTDEWVSTNATKEHWATLDYGTAKAMSMVKIYHGGVQDVHITKSFKIQGSTDNSTWTDLTSVITDNNTRITTHSFPTAYYRYIRMYIYIPCSTDDFSRVYEIQTYGIDASLTRINDVNVEVDSTFGAFDASNLLDGKWAVEDSDEWVSTGTTPNHYAILDLKQNFNIKSVVIRHSTNLITQNFTIDGSNNKADWTTLYTGTDNNINLTELNLATPVNYRYVRLNITKPSLGDNFARIFEFEVWTPDDAASSWQKVTSSSNWSASMPAMIPGSIHTALFLNGVIPDPYVGRNSQIGKSAGNQHYWFRKTFTKMDAQNQKLIFDGVCDYAEFWLNGTKLGFHEGMFTQFSYDINSLLVDGTNTLIVHLNPTRDWGQTVVFNNTYGWHYLDMPPLGIWRSVRVEGSPTVDIIDPFVVTMNLDGTMRLSLALKGDSAFSGTLKGTISPENFTGESKYFTTAINSATAEKKVLYEFNIPNPKLWWPNDYGDSNLYKLELSFVKDGGGVSDYYTTNFGIRTLKQLPTAQGQKPSLYNWILEVNGVRVPIKGANWCTLDAMMRFERSRYDRFLTLAKSQHINFLRLWGSGMVETDDMYDLADRYGIMLLQEWPTAWNSDKTQPQALLNETVRQATLRLRNHPALVMYGGGNESNDPVSPAIIQMGKYANVLDGTRVFHRAEPWGGSGHNYNVYWGGAPLDYNLSFQDFFKLSFIGEFGAASVPNEESVLRYIPDNEKNVWPLGNDSGFAYKTPTFNTLRGYGLDLGLLTQYSNYFTKGETLKTFVTGSQISQAVADRHAMENARIFFPSSGGVAYYKLTDNNPAASWACIDAYGVPKISHFLYQDSYAPLAALVKIGTLNPGRKAISWPVYLLDDTNALKNSSWSATTKVYNTELEVVASMTKSGTGSVGYVLPIGNIDVPAEKMNESPMFIVTDVKKDGVLAQRVYYFINYEKYQNSMFTMLPLTTVTKTDIVNGKTTITNTGNKPAVAVHFEVGAKSSQFLTSDNYFWLNPGESTTLDVSMMSDIENPSLDKSLTGIDISAWNMRSSSDTTAPTAPSNFTAVAESFNKVSLNWNASTDVESGIEGYAIFKDNTLITTVNGAVTSFVDRNVLPLTNYTYNVAAINGAGLRALAAAVTVTTPEDLSPPEIATLKAAEANQIELSFTKPVTGIDVLANYSIDGGATITSVALKNSTTVVINTSSLTPFKEYTLSVANVVPNTVTTKTFVSRLMGHWTFDNDDADTAYDSSGYGLDGAKTGGQTALGKKGNAFQALTNTDVVLTQSVNTSFPDGFTVSGWINSTSNSGFFVLFSKGDKVAGHFEVYLSNGNLCLYAPDLGDFTTTALVADGAWHQFAATLNGNTVSLYKDGVLVKATTTTGTLSSYKAPFEINGFTSGVLGGAGKFDDVRLYSYPMSASEVNALYNLN